MNRKTQRGIAQFVFPLYFLAFVAASQAVSGELSIGKVCSQHADCGNGYFCYGTSSMKRCYLINGTLPYGCELSNGEKCGGDIFSGTCFFKACVTWPIQYCGHDPAKCSGANQRCVQLFKGAAVTSKVCLSYVNDLDGDGLDFLTDCDESSKLCTSNCDLDGDGTYDNKDDPVLFDGVNKGKRDVDSWDCKDDCIDRDGDGSCAPDSAHEEGKEVSNADCDDTDDAVGKFEGFNIELNSCDLKDNDCDGQIDECPNKEVSVGGGKTESRPQKCFYKKKKDIIGGDCVVFDADGDGYDDVKYGGTDCNDDPTKDGKSYNPGVYDGYKYVPPPPTVEKKSVKKSKKEKVEEKVKKKAEELEYIGSAVAGPPIEDSIESPFVESAPQGNLITGMGTGGESASEVIPSSLPAWLGDNNCNGIIETPDTTDDDDTVLKQFDSCIEKDGLSTTGKNYGRTPPKGAVIDTQGCSLSTVTGKLPGWSAGPKSAVAYVVKDDTNPSVGKHALYVKSVLDNDFINYTAHGKGNSTYTFSFLYHIEAGALVRVKVSEVGGTDLLAPVDLSDLTWTRASFTLSKTSGKSVDPKNVRIEFFMPAKDTVFYIDNLQFENAPEVTMYNDFKYEYGCCPQDYCWAGEVEVLPGWSPHCIQDDFYEKNVTFPALGTLQSTTANNLDPLTGNSVLRNGYRCIKSGWKFSRVKFSELHDAAAFCPEDDQCFHFNGTTTSKAEEACVSSGNTRTVTVPFVGKTAGSRLESYYCYQGNWTTRTKAVALALLSFTKPTDTYTLFCDRYSHALNAQEQESGASLPTVSEESPIRGIGDTYKDVVPYLKGITDEFCVLRLNDQVIAGVSLNVNVSELLPAAGGGELKGFEPGKEPSGPAYSFIEALKNDKTYCAGVTDATKDEFKACKNTDVYYNPHLKSVIFTKVTPSSALQEVPFKPGPPVTFIDKAFDLLKKLFNQLLNVFGLVKGKAVETIPLASQLDFVRKAGDFDKLYVSNFPDAGRQKTITAVRETRFSAAAGGKLRTFLTANYQNYKTDICNYFNFRIAQAGDVIRSQISNDDIHCDPIIYNETNWAYNVYVEMPKLDENYVGNFPVDYPDLWKQGADNFWNDITAQVRSRAADSTPPDAPLPVIDKVEVSDDKPSQGVSVNITPVISKNPGDIIARTWYFGDDTSYTTWFNLSTEHVYALARPLPYTVTVYVMNKHFKITKDTSTKLTVGPKVSVDIITNPPGLIPPGTPLQVQAKITNGKPPYNLVWDFGNGTGSAFTDTLKPKAAPPYSPPYFVPLAFDAEHQVKYKAGCAKYNVTVMVVDKDGVTPVTKYKEVIQNC